MRYTHFLTLIAALLLSGCATVQTAAEERDPQDPFEGFNRAVYSFNDQFDRAILRPVAEGYQKVVPTPINRGISNFFSNLDDFVVLINDLLQLKFTQAGSDFARIAFNSTFGLLGFIDVASHMDAPKHNEDFGQTLGYWGVGTGPYLVLPFLGPSTLRDSTGLVADSYSSNPLFYVEDRPTLYGAVGLKAVDTRAGLLKASELLEQAALDPYVFHREAYLQRRLNLVYDGNPPVEEFDPFSEEFLFEEGIPAEEPK